MADMTRDEMADDYKRLKREYTLLHQDYRRAEGRLLREQERIVNKLESLAGFISPTDSISDQYARSAYLEAIKIVKGESDE